MDNSLKRNISSKYFPWIAVGTILIVTAFIRLSMLQIPLERDEGEYAYMGQLLLQGIPPYLMAYSMKLPGMFAIYAIIIGIFGQSVGAIHLGLLIFNGIAIILVFLLTRYFADEIAGVIAAMVYAFLSASPFVLGTVAHATQFIVPFALGGIFLLLKAIDQKKTWMLIASGLLLGSAFIIKQHAFFFVLFAVIYYFIRLKNMPLTIKGSVYNTSALIVSSMIPFLTVCGLLYLAGAFPSFWFWTFTYSSQYASEIPFSMAMTKFMEKVSLIIYPWIIIWIIAVIGLSSVFWNKKTRDHWYFWIGFSVFSFLSVCPGFYFRSHYFVTLFPAVSMLTGVAVSASMIYLSKRSSSYLKILPVILISAAIVIPIWQQARYYRGDSTDINRRIYGIKNPFVESLPVAEYIKNHSSGTDTIAVIGSEPQIYFYANRKSATGYIYMYEMMKSNNYASQMQKEMAQEIESARPRYIVFVNAERSWLMDSNSDRYIINWTKKYLEDYYCLRGVINTMSDLKLKTDVNPRETGLIWRHTMSVLERKQQ
jgi:4-amino-4-deoxy-L-arabinose transferase-like glycosyltransferase